MAVPAGRRTAAEVDVRTSGQWQPIGRISSGYAELPVKGLSVDAVRLRWLENSTAPAVAEVVPVPSGVPAALTVDPAALVADAGAQVSATLTVASTALAAVRGRLQVTAPASVTVPRVGRRVRTQGRPDPDSVGCHRFRVRANRCEAAYGDARRSYFPGAAAHLSAHARHQRGFGLSGRIGHRVVRGDR
ncbi:hypothetical protein [Fodinicola feengrottensis]|uniref:hypothetical protein n=1 Tax=Fodinicola feengrottensis TaxID=435914 RepID=UPI0024435A37|nr:hypothetical protein [Fodinicola feengrottensis]